MRTLHVMPDDEEFIAPPDPYSFFHTVVSAVEPAWVVEVNRWTAEDGSAWGTELGEPRRVIAWGLRPSDTAHWEHGHYITIGYPLAIGGSWGGAYRFAVGASPEEATAKAQQIDRGL